jgi:hypothetical protein
MYIHITTILSIGVCSARTQTKIKPHHLHPTGLSPTAPSQLLFKPPTPTPLRVSPHDGVVAPHEPPPHLKRVDVGSRLGCDPRSAPPPPLWSSSSSSRFWSLSPSSTSIRSASPSSRAPSREPSRIPLGHRCRDGCQVAALLGRPPLLPQCVHQVRCHGVAHEPEQVHDEESSP